MAILKLGFWMVNYSKTEQKMFGFRAFGIRAPTVHYSGHGLNNDLKVCFQTISRATYDLNINFLFVIQAMTWIPDNSAIGQVWATPTKLVYSGDPKTGHVRFLNGRPCLDFAWQSEFKWFWQNGSHFVQNHLVNRPSKSPDFEWSVFGSPLYFTVLFICASFCLHFKG